MTNSVERDPRYPYWFGEDGCDGRSGSSQERRGLQIPRRLVYIVDRVRSSIKPRKSRTRSEKPWSGIRTWAALKLNGRPLPISTLRGQHVDNKQWLEDPSLPAIIVGTIDMIGSRLLFEGYGVSRKMRPYHAGLLGSGYADCS